MISVRRQAEGMLERPGEMVGTEPRQLGEGRERDVVRETLLDIGRHALLLPRRKASPTDGPAESGITADASQLVRQHDAERFGVLRVHRVRVDLRLELERDLPEIAIVKEQARLELDLAEPQLGIGERPARIDVEIGCTRQRARLLPSAKVIPGRYEGQFLREIAQGRPGQAFNKGLTVVALRELCSNEQVVGARNPYSNGMCRMTWTVSTCKPDQAAEWRSQTAKCRQSSEIQDPSTALPAGAIRRSDAREG